MFRIGRVWGSKLCCVGGEGGGEGGACELEGTGWIRFRSGGQRGRLEGFSAPAQRSLANQIAVGIDLLRFAP